MNVAILGLEIKADDSGLGKTTMRRLLASLFALALWAAPASAADLFSGWTGDKIFTDPNNNNVPLAAGTIDTWDATTENDRTVYKETGESNAHTNPIVLDSNGQLPAAVYVPTGSWKYRIQDSGGTTIHTEDNIPGAVTTVTTNFAREKCPTQAKTADFTVVTSDAGDCFMVAPAAATTATLPSATTLGDGQQLTFKKTNANAFTLTIATVSSQTIDGVGTSRIIYAPNELMRLVSDGANWHVISHTKSEACPVVAKTGAYTVVTADDRVCFHGGTNAFTFTLPSAVTVRNGWKVSFRNTNDDNDDITVATVSSQTINGSGTSRVLDSFNEVLGLVSDGTNWQIIGDIGATEKTAQLPIGAVIMMSDDDACPSGFLELDGGTANLTASYPELFNLWSDDNAQTSIYGETDANSFDMADSRGRFVRHIPDGAANQDPDAASRTDRGDGTGADVVGSLQSWAVKEHIHGNTSSSGGAVSAGAGVDAFNAKSNNTTTVQTSSGDTEVLSGNLTANETRPTNIGFRFCVFADSTP